MLPHDMQLSTEQKPRMRTIRMGVYAGDELLWEYDRFELRPMPASPYTPDRTFIGISSEKVYRMWRDQVEFWQGKIDAPLVRAEEN